MKNEKKAAFSVALKENGNAFHPDAMGLTKLEYFAAAAMNGLLSNQGQIDTTGYNWVATNALSYAKEILAELEKVPS